MMTISIVALLASMGVNIYNHHITQSKRMRAESILLQLAIALEEYHLEQGRYSDATLSALKSIPPLENSDYAYSLTSTDDDYLLRATPKGKQAERDSCGVLSLNAIGEKNASGYPSAVTCW